MEKSSNTNRFANLALQGQAEREEEKQAAKPGFMSLKKALDLARGGASGEQILTQAVPIRAPARATSDSGRDHAQYENCPPIPIAPKGKIWVELNQLVGGRPSEEQMRELFVGKPNFTPVAGIQRDPKDPHYKQGGGKENLCSVVHGTRMIKQAPDCYTRIVASSEDEFEPDMITQVRTWGEAARSWVVTNGPLLSCFQRLSAAAGVKKPVGRLYIDPETIDAVCKMLPWRQEYVRNLKGQTPDQEWVVLNLVSNSGFPWDKPKRDVLADAYTVAVEILNSIATGTVAKLIAEHPQWMLVKVMNKLDRYDSTELRAAPPSGVVRQYFVYGFHWVILFSTINQNISQSMVGFWDDPKSFSAHGFAWQDGGPQKIINWIRWAVKQGPGLYGIAYSDDQLWVIVAKDGQVAILTPDIKRMDLNLVSTVGRLYFEYGKRVLGQNVDKTWEAVFKLHCRLAFDCPVILEYSIVMETTNFLHSGVPGTPEFDQVASAAYFYHLKKYVGEPATLDDAKRLLELGMKKLEGLTGLSMKPWQLFPLSGRDETVLDERKNVLPPDTPSVGRRKAEPSAVPPKSVKNAWREQAVYRTPWTFLGKSLMFDPMVHGWLPCSDPVRALASILSPKSKQDGVSGVRGQMQRVRQIIAGGAFGWQQLYYGAKSWYSTVKGLGNTPADPFEPADQELVDRAVDLEMTLKFKGNEFPSYFECANIYLPVGSKYTLATAVPQRDSAERDITTGAKLGTEVISAADLVSRLFNEEQVVQPGSAWADLEPEAPRRVLDQDKGASNVSRLEAVPPEQMGRAPPKTAEEVAALRKKQAEKYRERVAQAYRSAREASRTGDVVVSLKGRALLGQKQLQAIEKIAEEADAFVDEEEHEYAIDQEDIPDDATLDRMVEDADYAQAYYTELDDRAKASGRRRYMRRQIELEDS
nr:MAG: RNA-dependent RNA polymerase [Permutotetraviridae sp.]